MRPTIKFASASLLALFTLGACTETGTLPNNGDRTRTGAAVGAGIGAILGATKESGNDRVRNAAQGAILGGLAGAGVGAILDRQAEELRGSLDGDIGVINTGNELIVRMPQDILFPVDSAVVQAGLRDDLFTLARSLNKYPNSTVTVVGHTDNTGSAAYNQDLSERRANSVAAVLINAGVAPGRIRAIGAGENSPIASNLSPEGRSQNRRVDITITPN